MQEQASERTDGTTRRDFLKGSVGLAGAATGLAFPFSKSWTADPLEIPAFEPDMNGLMSVRHQWFLKMHKQAAELRRKEASLHAGLRNPEDVAAWGKKIREFFLQRPLGGCRRVRKPCPTKSCASSKATMCASK